jgi:hypothetical protein
MVAHHLLQKLADLLRRVVGIEFEDLLLIQPIFQGHAVVAAGDGEEEKERLPATISKRVLAMMVLGDRLRLNVRLRGLQSGIDEGAKEEIRLGSLRCSQE